MASFAFENIQDITASFQSGLAAASEAWSKVFAPVVMSIGEASQPVLTAPPAELQGAGLKFSFRSGGEFVVGAIASGENVLPAWVASPDENQQTRLNTLASELGRALFEQWHLPSESTLEFVADLAGTFAGAAWGSSPCLLPITIQLVDGEVSRSGTLFLFGPKVVAEASSEVRAASSGETSSDVTSDATDSESSRNKQPVMEEPVKPNVGPTASPSPGPAFRPVAPPARRRVSYVDVEEGIDALPPYSRSLLKIQVPLRVTLAETKLRVSNILEIGPGSIIHFNKSCEDTLTLEAGDQKVAVGEAVKVGDKFGLWITSMIMPDERFWVIGPNQASKRAK